MVYLKYVIYETSNIFWFFQCDIDCHTDVIGEVIQFVDIDETCDKKLVNLGIVNTK